MKKLLLASLLLISALAYAGYETGSAYQVLAVPSGGGRPKFSALTLSQSAATTGQLPVTKGGTGLAAGTSGGIPYFSSTTALTSSGALTANGVVLGGGAGATPVATSAGSAYQPLRVPSGGGAPAFGAIDLSQSAAVTGILATANGGTGASSLAAFFHPVALITYAHSTAGDCSRTSTSLGDFTCDSAMPAPTIAYDSGDGGTWATTDSNLPQIAVTSMPAGVCVVEATFSGSNYGGTSQNNAYRITDGTTNGPIITSRHDGAAGGEIQSVTVRGVFNYVSSGSHTFKIQGASTSGTNYIVMGNAVYTNLAELSFLVTCKF